MTHWFVYLIRTEDTAIYTGITTDVTRRLDEHRHHPKKGAKYFRGKKQLSLVYIKAYSTRATASIQEAKIKRLPKKQKEALIQSDENEINTLEPKYDESS